MKTVTHQAISASAGSGKTFQLAHRFIRLLAYGVAPERIIALTFSRKAAGEIFDAVVRNLCRSASSEKEAKCTNERIEADLVQADYARLLRAVLHSLHRLHIGTLDSFTIGIVKAFPLELGLSADFDILDQDGPLASSIREEVLGKLFNDRSVDRKAQDEFLEAFKLATFGQEEKGLQHVLEKFIEDYHRDFLMLPEEAAWGNEKRLWPKGNRWLEGASDVASAAVLLKTFVAESEWNKKLLTSLDRIVEFAGGYDEKSPWDSSITTSVAFKILLQNASTFEDGQGVFVYNRKEFKLGPDESRAFYALLQHVLQTEIHRALVRTRGIYRILHEYEKQYDSLVRRRGKLTFEDAQYLLTDSNALGGRSITRMATEDARLYIDYRLDSRLDHWLLDEFQDTSDLQWEVLRNLVDEILQDASGEKSFFYVGDVKQAIYGWRGGNAKLFNEILDTYGDQIQRSPLSKSFRSCQPVIEAVNEVFGQLPTGRIPQAAVTAWQNVWEEHSSETSAVPPTGYVALLEPPFEDEKNRPTVSDRYRVVASILKEIDPINKALSTAVLVRGNEEGRELVNLLREQCPEMNIAHEGRAQMMDNPVVALLLALVKFAAHPGDTLAWQHLKMSPLHDTFVAIDDAKARVPLMLLSEIYRKGYQAFVTHWGDQLDQQAPLDAFGRKRLTDLIDAAGEFDRTGSRDADAFLRFINKYKTQEVAAENVIRVMTIHQSKGLGFDIVILPDLQGRGITGAGAVDLVRNLSRDKPQDSWALKFPRRAVAQCDEMLSSAIQVKDQESAFDALCVLYVAMTRAKQALYMITGYPGKDSVSYTHATLLKSQLCNEEKPVTGDDIVFDSQRSVCLFERGDRAWFKLADVRAAATAATDDARLPPAYSKQASKRRRVLSVSPSRSAEGVQGAAHLFTDSAHEGRELGAAVHELFEGVSWVEELDLDALCKAWQEKARHTDALKALAIRHVTSAVGCEDVREALSKPAGHVELWREKSFEIVLDEEWITGTFDRVVIEYHEDGTPARASVIDYKSNDVTEDDVQSVAVHYRPQLQFYQRVLSNMLDLTAEKIVLQLIFTKLGRVVTL